jgi:hypothetical protein
VDETFDGADRPLARMAWDAGGRLVQVVQWTYENDARGNWIRKIPHEDLGGRNVAVLRVIEYAD